MIINHILIKTGKRKEKKKQDPSRFASKCSDIVLPPTKGNKNKGILRMTRKIRKKKSKTNFPCTFQSFFIVGKLGNKVVVINGPKFA